MSTESFLNTLVDAFTTDAREFGRAKQRRTRAVYGGGRNAHFTKAGPGRKAPDTAVRARRYVIASPGHAVDCETNARVARDVTARCNCFRGRPKGIPNNSMRRLPRWAVSPFIDSLEPA